MNLIEFTLFVTGSIILAYSDSPLVAPFAWGFYPPIILVFVYMLYLNLIAIYALRDVIIDDTQWLVKMFIDEEIEKTLRSNGLKL